jgi:hypothetical protein
MYVDKAIPLVLSADADDLFGSLWVATECCKHLVATLNGLQQQLISSKILSGDIS